MAIRALVEVLRSSLKEAYRRRPANIPLSIWKAYVDDGLHWYLWAARDNMDPEYALMLTFELQDPRVWKWGWELWLGKVVEGVEYRPDFKPYAKAVLLQLDRLLSRMRPKPSSFVSVRPLTFSQIQAAGLPRPPEAAKKIMAVAKDHVLHHLDDFRGFAEDDLEGHVVDAPISDGSHFWGREWDTFTERDQREIWNAFRSDVIDLWREKRRGHW
jgi:hypothetical protein